MGHYTAALRHENNAPGIAAMIAAHSSVEDPHLLVVDDDRRIRSLLSLTFLSLVYAYFFDRKIWMRWVLLIATVPIAIIATMPARTGVFVSCRA